MERFDCEMSKTEMSKSFYYPENVEYSPDDLYLMSFGEEEENSLQRPSDCRFQSLANNMVCSSTLRRRETFGGAHSLKNPSPRKHGRRSLANRPIYRHIPHKDKPPHLVARRNARERRRVQAVNNAFCRLRRHVPYENKQKRLSKVKTLRFAIDYINKMKSMLEEHDGRMVPPPSGSIDCVAVSKSTRWTNERFFTVENEERYRQSDFGGFNKRLEHYSAM